MSEWQPIETAPKDGTYVDLWVVQKYVRHPADNKCYRIANARWQDLSKQYHNYAGPAWVHFGQYANSTYGDEVELELAGGSQYATHWMPLPNPPK